jgi:hypothetical protein
LEREIFSTYLLPKISDLMKYTFKKWRVFMATASSPIGRAIVVSPPLPGTVVDADSDHNIETN